MAHHKLKITAPNIINLWFGQDTPIRVYKIKMNPVLWAACQQTNQTFNPPSGALSVKDYRKSDLICFAKEVQLLLHQAEPSRQFDEAFA